MKRSLFLCLLTSVVLLSCSRSNEHDPAKVANAFLRAVHQEHCKEAFGLFSRATQAAIVVESEIQAKQSPHYADQFSPENLFCKATYANHYLSFVKDSAVLKSVNGTNAIVIAKAREGTDFLIPGFWPTKFTNKPAEMYLVKEDGAWKLDLPYLRDYRLKPREEARKKEEEDRIEQARRREVVVRSCPPALTLVAHWTFETITDNVAPDTTGNFQAQLLGARPVNTGQGPGVQFFGGNEMLVLPNELLHDRQCGVISFWLRRETTNSSFYLFHKLNPGISADLYINAESRGTVFFTIAREHIYTKTKLDVGRFQHLACVWNEDGKKIYIDGKLESHSPRITLVGSTSQRTIIGRDARNERLGSHMTIRDWRFYGGRATDADIARIYAESQATAGY